MNYRAPDSLYVYATFGLNSDHSEPKRREHIRFVWYLRTTQTININLIKHREKYHEKDNDNSNILNGSPNLYFYSTEGF